MISELGALEPPASASSRARPRCTTRGRKRTRGHIGSELGVDYVLEGSVRREGSGSGSTRSSWKRGSRPTSGRKPTTRSRPTSSTSRRTSRWRSREPLDPTLSNPRASLAVAPTSFAAYEFTLQGRFFREQATEESTRKAIEYFDRAIAVDPTMPQPSPVWATPTGCSARRVGSRGAGGCCSRRKGRQRNGPLPSTRFVDAHAAMAMVHFTYDWDLVAAESESRMRSA